MTPARPPEERPSDLVRLALLERETADIRKDVESLRGMMAAVIGKLDTLCDELTPVVKWAAREIAEEAKDTSSWRETVRAAKRDMTLWALKVGLALVAGGLGIGYFIGGN